MLLDRVSNPGPDLRVRCPTDCATRPGLFIHMLKLNFDYILFVNIQEGFPLICHLCLHNRDTVDPRYLDFGYLE